jgi:hypothetical protein
MSSRAGMAHDLRILGQGNLRETSFLVTSYAVFEQI